MAVPVPTPPPELEVKPSAPLLPPVLLGPAALLWLWIIPITILLLLNLQGYNLIEGNMDATESAHAHALGLAGVLNLVIALGLYFAGRRLISRNSSAAGHISAWWGVPAVAVQIAYLGLCLYWGESELLPRSVTAWIYPEQRFFYNQFAFAMLPLFWGLLRLACAQPSKQQGRTIAFNLSIAIAAPVLLYTFFQLLVRVDKFLQGGIVFIGILISLLGVAMFVALIRGLAHLLRHTSTWSVTRERLAILCFAFVLPLAGLWLNSSIPFPNDFQAWEVYALTTLNAAILLLASCWHTRRPLLSFSLLCVTLPFTLYFFVVFLPFLPLSIVAVIAFGAGFLVLTPTVLLVLHLSLLAKTRHGPTGRWLLVGGLSFLLLPAFFTGRALADKAALNAALNYVYTPAIRGSAITCDDSLINLRRALANHHSYKNGIYYPLLSDYYSWLVFDHLVLPDNKLARLEQVFFGTSSDSENDNATRRDGGRSRASVRDRDRMPRAAPAPRTVALDSLVVTQTPTEGKATVVTLQLTLTNTGSQPAEYVKTLPLPAGIYVTGFRLHINGTAVPGRITEKKTALWVYTMIRDSERRDPGLLFYNRPDELELRAFPVVAGTPSIVAIDFLVPAALADKIPLPMDNDPATVLSELGQKLSPRIVRLDNGQSVVVGLERLALPIVKREPYLHVIVDRSADQGFDGDLSTAIAALRRRFPSSTTPEITLTNYETRVLTSPQDSLSALPLRGGFSPDLAISQALQRHRDLDLDAGSSDEPPPRPVFVILSRQLPSTPLTLEISPAWRDLVAGLEIHATDTAGGFITLFPAEPAADAPLLRLGHSLRPWVRNLPAYFTSGPGTDVLSYWSPEESAWQPLTEVNEEPANTQWGRAVGLQVLQQNYARTPGNSGVDLKTLVQTSRASGVMLACTSYIVVENTAQWRMLDISERQKLDQNSALDFKEAPAPTALWLVAGFAAWIFLRQWLRRQKPLTPLPQ